tara:strand:+ start:1785 stop:2450 length:666 start_codon:yes stop_codon:yes gene_type:complete
MNKIIPFYYDINLDSLYFNNLKYKKKENCYKSKIKYLEESNSLSDLLFQTDEVILNDIILDENGDYFLKADIINNDLFEFFFNLENKIKNNVYAKSKEWFNIEPSEKIKEIYKSLFDLPLLLDKPPCLKIKIPISKGCIKSKFFDKNKEMISINQLQNNTRIKLIIKINNIELLESEYKLDIYLYQLQMSNLINLDLNNFFEESDEDIILSNSEDEDFNIC